jgi:probable phosphoglycerate mutase
MRHGHVDYFSAAVLQAKDHRIAHLTEVGRDQARAAGAALKEVAFDFAVCSGLVRTRETAELVLLGRDDAPDLIDELELEELRGGTLRFESSEAAAAAMQAQFARAHEPGAQMFGGEAFSEAQARAVATLTRLILAPDAHCVLIVAHEGINRLVLSWALGARLSAASAIEQDTACVNVIDFDVAPDQDGAPAIARSIVKAVNITPYNWLKRGMHRTSLEAIFAGD